MKINKISARFIVFMFIVSMIFIAGCNSHNAPPLKFDSREKCEQETGKLCGLMMCDYNCGNKWGNYWTPTNGLLNESIAEETNRKAEETKLILDNAQYTNISGEVVCLPNSDNSKECIVGLKSNDDDYSVNSEYWNLPFKVGDKVRIEGKINLTGGKSSKISGIIYGTLNIKKLN